MAFVGVYRITNKQNGKFYIGSSDDVVRRWSRHLLDLKKNRHDNPYLQNAWNKYGGDSFIFEIYKECSLEELLVKEQTELDLYVGTPNCYNIRKSAVCPVASGSVRPQWVREKISAAQKGVPRWTNEQKMKMSVDRAGRTHSVETIKKMAGRVTSRQNIQKAQQANLGRIYSSEHCLHISEGKLESPKMFTDKERNRIKDGVKKAVAEGRYHKNKVPKEEYETIKEMYLSGNINKRQLAFKYGINPSSMQKLLQRIGV